ncbi:MAG: L,D-transpeptidase family protein [Chloroflexi bacterium]|nr:L,D-transpeptidase family protein [Chloroflexota bacterium]
MYDPRTGGISQWTAAPQSWAGWLRAESDPAAPGGLRLSLEDGALRGFLAQGEARLESDQYIDVDAVVERVQAAIGQRSSRVTARIYHRDRQRVVLPGETIISIAYDEGVPYPWIQQANGGIQLVNAGQAITIPSVDHFMPFEPVPGKRIIVSLSQQRVWVYENGAVKWEWPASTGIASSPTWPGIYQVISHVPNAYAGNWNLWMPNFMGVYQPILGADFTNGFHGFPTRGGGQILWGEQPRHARDLRLHPAQQYEHPAVVRLGRGRGRRRNPRLKRAGESDEWRVTRKCRLFFTRRARRVG